MAAGAGPPAAPARPGARAGGSPSGRFPWPWSVVPWLEGGPGDRTPITAPADAAGRLGRFLRALHQPAPPGAPANPSRGVPLAEGADLFERRVADLDGEVDGPAARRAWERACAVPRWSGPPMWVHGDLHPGNTLVASGTLAAVIDFGDLCAGDPAVDLAAAWMLLPGRALPAFARAYGGAGADLWERARGWAVLFALMLVAIGLEDPPTYAAVGRSTLDRVLAA